MPLVRFTQNIQRHVACPSERVNGATLRESLRDYFRLHPQAEGYILDDQRALRRHMAIFLDGRPIVDRAALSDAVRADSTIDVMQALSGG